MKADVLPLSLPGVMLIRSTRISDSRGSFAETYVRGDFAKSGIPNDFVQDNQSVSFSAGTVRGLHFQIPPFQQAKLIRVLRGRIFDVVVDLRHSSATYGAHVSVELSAEGGEQLFVLASRTVSALWSPRPKFFIRSMPCIRLRMTAELIGSIRR